MMDPLPHEREYVCSPENLEVAKELTKALSAKDRERIDELAKQLIVPLSRLKHLGKEFVLENGLPTITAEIVNDTDWLK